MGTDIHFFVEQTHGAMDGNNQMHWWHCADMSLDRNYEVFGLLANVRCDGRMFESQPWPGPHKLGYRSQNYFYDTKPSEEKGETDTVAGSFADGKYVYVDKDFHNKCVLTGEQFITVIAAAQMKDVYVHASYKAAAAYITCLMSCSFPEYVRVVFAFDS